MTVRPNRGTVVFFVLLAVALVARTQFAKQHAQSFRQDAPQAHSTRRLLRCVLGADVERYLHPRPPRTDGARWERLISARMRRMVTEYEPAEWLGRCVPISDRLTARLELARGATRAASLSRAVAVTLRDAQASRLRAIELVESGTLGSQLALLALEAGSLSDGADEAWSSPLGPQASDLEGAVREANGAASYTFPANAEYVTLALPQMALYQHTGSRLLHRVLLDPRRGSTADTDLDADNKPMRGAPVRGSAREGATLVSDDAGDALFLPSGEPAALVALPEPLRRGERSLGEWGVTFAGGSLWLATESEGRLSFWRTPSAGAVDWHEVAPAVDSPWRELFAYGALLSPSSAPRNPESTDGAAQVVARAQQRERLRGRNDPLPAGATLAPAPAPPAAAVVRAAVFRAEGQGFRVERWSVGERAEAVRPLGAATGPIAAFSPQLRTCTAEGSQYFLVVTSDRLVSISLRSSDADGADASVSTLPYSSWDQPSGGALSLSCNARGLLLATEFSPDGRTTIAWFEQGAGEAVRVAPPLYGPRAAVVAATLTDRGPLALVQNDNTLRAYLLQDRAWTGGALLSELAPFGRPAPVVNGAPSAAPSASAAPEEESALPTAVNGLAVSAPPAPSTVSVGALVSDGSRVGVLLEVHTDGGRHVVWAGSTDAGLRWGSGS